MRSASMFLLAESVACAVLCLLVGINYQASNTPTAAVLGLGFTAGMAALGVALIERRG